MHHSNRDGDDDDFLAKLTRPWTDDLRGTWNETSSRNSRAARNLAWAALLLLSCLCLLSLSWLLLQGQGRPMRVPAASVDFLNVTLDFCSASEMTRVSSSSGNPESSKMSLMLMLDIAISHHRKSCNCSMRSEQFHNIVIKIVVRLKQQSLRSNHNAAQRVAFLWKPSHQTRKHKALKMQMMTF